MSTLYHATDRFFDRFDIQMAGTNPVRSANCALGLWFAVDYGWLEAFGSRLIVAEVDLSGCYRMNAGELRRLTRVFNRNGTRAEAVRRWIEYRAQLIAKGHLSVALAEQDQFVGIYAVLDPSRIQSHHDARPLLNTGMSEGLRLRRDRIVADKGMFTSTG